MKNFFSKSGLQHTYQRTLDKGVFLYKTSERLMLFTILSVCATQHSIVVCALAFMFTHIHSLSKVDERDELGHYFGHAISIYVREVNSFTGRSGPMFDSIDSASKIREKKIKEAISYVYNNSVEKKLFRKAEEDRWSFLAYFKSDHPFSPRLVKRKASYKMRQSCRIVDIEHKAGRYLNLALLNNLFDGLGKTETEQLIDYIISRYNFISYEETIKYYSCFEDMCKAIEVTAGKEYDIKEEFDSLSEVPILQMLKIAKKEGLLEKDTKIYTLSKQEKIKYKTIFTRCTDASEVQIKKFLHI